MRQPDRAPSGSEAAAGLRPESGFAPYGVAATYWVEAASGTAPAEVHFSGVLVSASDDGDVEGDGGTAERFERVEFLPELPAGVGRTSLTTRVPGLAEGTWAVRAQGVDAQGKRTGEAQEQVLRTRLVPLLHGPGVHPAAWPILVLIGMVVAIASQSVFVGRAGLDRGTAALVAVAATVIGYLTAKIWYMVLHRLPPARFAGAGTCIQGFLLGAFGSLTTLSLAVGLPVGALLDLTTPGVFAAMALARPGCWLGGCCAGRPSTSRWALWSSDRTVGVRRMPVQFLESALTGAIAALGAGILWARPAAAGGLLLMLSAALYTLGRQGLFPLRTEPRRTALGPGLAAVVAGVAAAVSAVLLV